MQQDPASLGSSCGTATIIVRSWRGGARGLSEALYHSCFRGAGGWLVCCLVGSGGDSVS